MTVEEATNLARAYLDEMVRENPKYPLSFVDNGITKIRNGWVFSYQSKKFVESGDMEYFLFGNAPIIVDSRDGRVLVTGTAGRFEDYLTNFDETGDPHIEAVDFVRLVNWREGARKIDGTKTIRSFTELGLDRAKRCIDDALKGTPTDIQVSSGEAAKALCSALDELGWDCSVIRRAP